MLANQSLPAMAFVRGAADKAKQITVSNVLAQIHSGLLSVPSTASRLLQHLLLLTWHFSSTGGKFLLLWAADSINTIRK